MFATWLSQLVIVLMLSKAVFLFSLTSELLLCLCYLFAIYVCLTVFVILVCAHDWPYNYGNHGSMGTCHVGLNMVTVVSVY
jgi:hypothetical protein